MTTATTNRGGRPRVQIDPLIAAGDGLVAAMKSGNTGVAEAALAAWEAAKAPAESEESEDS